jgi:hypothetical protein
VAGQSPSGATEDPVPSTLPRRSEERLAVESAATHTATAVLLVAATHTTTAVLLVAYLLFCFALILPDFSLMSILIVLRVKYVSKSRKGGILKPFMTLYVTMTSGGRDFLSTFDSDTFSPQLTISYYTIMIPLTYCLTALHSKVLSTTISTWLFGKQEHQTRGSTCSTFNLALKLYRVAQRRQRWRNVVNGGSGKWQLREHRKR